MLYCFYFSDTEAFEACFRLLHDDDDDDDVLACARKTTTSTLYLSHNKYTRMERNHKLAANFIIGNIVGLHEANTGQMSAHR